MLGENPTSIATAWSMVGAGVANAVRRIDSTKTGSSTLAMSYDESGNMVSQTDSSKHIEKDIEVDSQDRIVRVRNGANHAIMGEYVYDEGGFRVRKSARFAKAGLTQDVEILYPSKFYGLEYASETNTLSAVNNIYLNGVRIAALNEGGGTAYYLTDQVDSVSTVLDEDGKTLSRIQYQPYGETFVHKGDTDFSPKYNSQELDKETNFYFYNARYYDPAIARFTSADTVIDGQWDTQGWNRYTYVKGNPIRYKDPTGHSGQGLPKSPMGIERQYQKPRVLPDAPAEKSPQSAQTPGSGTDRTGIDIGAPTDEEGGISYNDVSKGIHLGLDLLGFVPGFGIVFDGINAAYLAAEVILGVGDATWGDVGIAALAMVPVFGDAAAAGKLGYKVGKEALEHVDDAAKAAEAVTKGSDELAEGVAKNWKPPATEKHHTIPREIQKNLPDNVRSNPDIRGRKGLPNLKEIPYGKHREIHEGPGGGHYNERFKEEIEKRGGAENMTADDITRIRDDLVKEFNL